MVRRVKLCPAGLEGSARWNIQVFQTSVNKPVLLNGPRVMSAKQGVRKKKWWSGKQRRKRTDLTEVTSIGHCVALFDSIFKHWPQIIVSQSKGSKFLAMLPLWRVVAQRRKVAERGLVGA